MIYTLMMYRLMIYRLMIYTLMMYRLIKGDSIRFKIKGDSMWFKIKGDSMWFKIKGDSMSPLLVHHLTNHFNYLFCIGFAEIITIATVTWSMCLCSKGTWTNI